MTEKPTATVQVKLTIPRARYERWAKLCIEHQRKTKTPMTVQQYLLTLLPGDKHDRLHD